jgi:hypothetical protein
MRIAPILSLALLVFACGAVLQAQEEQLILDPPLSSAFPLAQSADGVHVRYPVLLNDHTVIHPEAVLHFIYLDPNAGTGNHGGSGSGGGGFRAQAGPHGTLSQPGEAGNPPSPAGAWGSNDGDPDAGIFDNLKDNDGKRGKSELQTEVWHQTDLFAQALDHASEVGTTLVYNLPERAHTLTALFDLPEGMLLAEVDGHVRVLSLSQKSPAFQGGIRPGDEIRSLAGGMPVVSLADFVRQYAATKRQAKVSGNPSYPIEVWRPSESQIVSIQVAAPPSIPHFF